MSRDQKLHSRRTVNYSEDFRDNITHLYKSIDTSLLGEEQKRFLQSRYNAINSLTATECAEFQRDLASWNICFKILDSDGIEILTPEVRQDWIQANFYTVLQFLREEEKPEGNPFISEATKYIEEKGNLAIQITVARSVDRVNQILAIKV